MEASPSKSQIWIRHNVKIKRIEIIDGIEEIKISNELLSLLVNNPINGRSNYSNSSPVIQARLEQKSRRESNSPKKSTNSVRGRPKLQKDKPPVPLEREHPERLKDKPPIPLEREHPERQKDKPPVPLEREHPERLKDKPPIPLEREHPERQKDKPPVPLESTHPKRQKDQLPVPLESAHPKRQQDQLPVPLESAHKKRQKDKSPVPLESAHSKRQKYQPPVPLESAHPKRQKDQLPVPLESAHPKRQKDKSPVPLESAHPKRQKDQPPIPLESAHPKRQKDQLPVPLESAHPKRQKDKSPVPLESAHTKRQKNKSPIPLESAHPKRQKDKSPSPHKREPPELQKDKSPSPHKREPPELQKDKSPSPLKREHPELQKDKPPVPLESAHPKRQKDQLPVPLESAHPKRQKDQLPIPLESVHPKRQKDQLPVPLESAHPKRQKDKSPVPLESAHTKRQKNKSPIPLESAHPKRQKDKSPSPHKREPPELQKDKSPSPLKREPPELQKDKSPSPLKREPPELQKDKSPSPLKREPPELQKDKSPSPHKREPPELQKDKSPCPLKREHPELQKDKPPIPQLRIILSKNLVIRQEKTVLSQEVVPSLPEKRTRFMSKKHYCESTCMVCSNMKPKRRKTNVGYKSTQSKMPVDVVQTTPLHEVASTPLDKCTVSNKTKGFVLAADESMTPTALKRERSNKRKFSPVVENKSVKLKKSACHSDLPDIHLSDVSSPGGTSGWSSLPQVNNYGASQSPFILTERMGDSPQSFIMPLGHEDLQTFATKERAGAAPVSALSVKTTGSQILEPLPESPDLPGTNMTTESYVSEGKYRKLIITPPDEYIRITDSGLLLCADVVKNCALELMGKTHKDIFLCINKTKSENPKTQKKEYYNITFDKGALKLSPVNLTFSPTAAEKRTRRAARKKSACLNTGSKTLSAPKFFSEKFLKVKDGLKASVPETKRQEELLVTPKAAEKCNSSVGEPGGSLVDTLPIQPENAVLQECDVLRTNSQKQAGKGTKMKRVVYSPPEEHAIKENISTVETVSQKLLKLRKNNIGQYQRMVQEAVIEQTECAQIVSPVCSASKHISEETANSNEGLKIKITSGRNSKVKKGGDVSLKESPVGKDLDLQGSPSAENLYQDPAEPKISSVYSISLEQHEFEEAAVNVNFTEHNLVETTSPQEELNETAMHECTTLKTNPPQEEVAATSNEFNEAAVNSQECSSIETTPHEKTDPVTTLGYDFSSSILLKQAVNAIAQQSGTVKGTGDGHTSAVCTSQEQTAGEPKMISVYSISYDQHESGAADCVLQYLDQASLDSPDDQCLEGEENVNSLSQEIRLTPSQALGESGTGLAGSPSLLCQIVVEQDSNVVPQECTTTQQGPNLVEPEMTGGVSVWLAQCPLVEENVESHPVQNRPQKPVLVEPGSSSAYPYSVAVMDFSSEHDEIGSIAKTIKEEHKYNADSLGADCDKNVTFTDLQVAQWKSQDTQIWFSSHGLSCFLKDFAEFDGPSLMEMVHCLNTQTQFLRSSLKEMGYKLPEILRLFSKLRTLPCRIGHEK